MAFKKGESGNPGGRTKDDGWLRQIARKYCPDAFNALIDGLKDDEPAIRIKSAEAILNRGYGRPKEQVDLSVSGGLKVTVIVE